MFQVSFSLVFFFVLGFMIQQSD
uniref:Uncharacterized protein n=1 Tax=Arundo donax TaxID=35708 RepID=A0A0A9ENP4_ARUDO